MRQLLAFIAVAATLVSVAQGQDTFDAGSQAKELSGLDELVHEARDFFDVGRYGAAGQKCRQVLAFDHRHKEALHGLELIKQARAKIAARPAAPDPYFFGLVYPQIVWELPGDPGTSAAEKARAAKVAALKAKLSAIMLDVVQYQSTPLSDALAHLSAATHEITDDGEDGSVTIELQLPETPPAAGVPTAPEPVRTQSAAELELFGSPSEAESVAVRPPLSANTPVTLNLSNVSVMDALASVGSAVGLKVKTDPDKVSLVPYDIVLDEPLLTIVVRLPPSFIGDPEDGPLSDTGTNEAAAKQFLESSGVTFPPGSKAIYLKRTSQLIVRDTQPNIDLVQALMSPGCCSVPPSSDAVSPPLNP